LPQCKLIPSKTIKLSDVAYEEIVLRRNNRLERLILDPEADFGYRPIEWLFLADSRRSYPIEPNG
jgi:hypothetical protein